MAGLANALHHWVTSTDWWGLIDFVLAGVCWFAIARVVFRKSDVLTEDDFEDRMPGDW